MVLLLAGCGVAGGLLLAALAIGRYPVAPGDVLRLLVAALGGRDSGLPAELSTVVFSVRLPRALAALLVGGSLAAAGAAYQNVFRNPLVSPDILGVGAGASLGSVLGIFLHLPVAGVQMLAFAGGLAALGLVGLLAGRGRERGGRAELHVLVLTGVVVGGLAGAGTSLLKVLADPYDQLPTINFWLLGSLASVRPADLAALLPAVAVGLVTLLLLRWRIDLLTLDDEEAASLGADVGRLRAAVVAGATLMTAATVSIAGNIGWVGLLVPHLARMLVGPASARLLPLAALLGGAFLLAVDTTARTVAGQELPLGIVTALLGAPFFLVLLQRTGGGWR